MTDRGNVVLPNLSLICAMDEERGIGRNNSLLWRLPADMKWFRAHTLDKTVLMGRNTFESIGGPLKRRRNVILSSRSDFAPPAGCEAVPSVEAALERIASTPGEVYVIGGGRVYEAFLPHAAKLVFTFLHHTFDADAHFPAWDEAGWELVYEQPGETTLKNPYSYTFREYRRKIAPLPSS